MITEQEINMAKESLKKATVLHQDIASKLARTKADLETAKAQGLATEQITGKNAELREASARELLGKMYDEVDRLQYEYDKTKLALDIARIEDSRINMLLRFMEL